MNRSSGAIYLNCMLTQIHKHKKHFYHFIRNSKKKHPSHLFQLVGYTVCARGMLLVFSICHILIRNKIRSVLYSSLFMLCRERERKKNIATTTTTTNVFNDQRFHKWERVFWLPSSSPHPSIAKH